MNIFHSLILGIVEGLTEFLPISSTAHLIVIGDWLRVPATDFVKTFEISIQLGAILAVVVLFWKRVWKAWNLMGKIIAAFIPTAIIGLAFYKIIKTFLMGDVAVIASALLIGGIILIIFERYYSKKYGKVDKATPENTSDPDKPKEELSAISYSQAVKIGIFQSLAIIPGVSRAGATIVGGLSLGVKRSDIVEFSFLLAIPTMIAATGLDLYKSRSTLALLNGHELLVWAIGFVVSFITAIIGVRFFIRYIQKNNFIPFGWYRIIFSIIIFAWLFIR